MKHDHHYFCNKDCQYYPCHPTDPDKPFNCLFCFCPLYNLGDNCGGNFSYIGDHIKDCSNCMYPHNPNNYLKIMQALNTKK